MLINFCEKAGYQKNTPKCFISAIRQNAQVREDKSIHIGDSNLAEKVVLCTVINAKKKGLIVW